MPNYNYYKTISANMLVTTHDMNFMMGFIKEDEIYNPQTGVSETRLRFSSLSVP
jgi:hypothetical protein